LGFVWALVGLVSRRKETRECSINNKSKANVKVQCIGALANFLGRYLTRVLQVIFCARNASSTGRNTALNGSKRPAKVRRGGGYVRKREGIIRIRSQKLLKDSFSPKLGGHPSGKGII
jgi:hypothetical protein